MHYKELSLLAALDVLLAEGSVAGAASRMHLSTPAMSRILGQIRELFDDPIFVRAGRGLVPTPKAEALRQPVREVVEAAGALLASETVVDIARVDRVFTLRVTDSFVASLGLPLLPLVAGQAPRARIRFAPQGDEGVEDLREGRVDLDIGVLRTTGPEVRLEPLLQDVFLGVVREGHRLGRGAVTPERFAGERHISVSRRGLLHGPVDTALKTLGLTREVAVVVPTFADALMFARTSDLVATVPDRLTASARRGMVTFPLPVPTGAVTVSQAWHPRFDADAAHQWLRACVRQVCREQCP